MIHLFLLFCIRLCILCPPVHFLSMWLSGIIAITNSNVDNASPWKIPHWIFPSVKLFPPAVNSTFQFFMVFAINFVNLSYIFYILRQSITQLCGIISYSFLLTIPGITIFFCLVLLSLRMCGSIYSSSPVPLVPLQCPFCSSRNSLRLINELKISSLFISLLLLNGNNHLRPYNCLKKTDSGND